MSDQIIQKMSVELAASLNNLLPDLARYQLDFTLPSIGTLDQILINYRGKKNIVDDALFSSAIAYLGVNLFNWCSVTFVAKASLNYFNKQIILIIGNKELNLCEIVLSVFVNSDAKENILSQLVKRILFFDLQPSNSERAALVAILATSAAQYFERCHPLDNLGNQVSLYLDGLIYPPLGLNENIPGITAASLLLASLKDLEPGSKTNLLLQLAKNPDPQISFASYAVLVALKVKTSFGVVLGSLNVNVRTVATSIWGEDFLDAFIEGKNIESSDFFSQELDFFLLPFCDFKPPLISDNFAIYHALTVGDYYLARELIEVLTLKNDVSEELLRIGCYLSVQLDLQTQLFTQSLKKYPQSSANLLAQAFSETSKIEGVIFSELTDLQKSIYSHFSYMFNLSTLENLNPYYQTKYKILKGLQIEEEELLILLRENIREPEALLALVRLRGEVKKEEFR